MSTRRQRAAGLYVHVPFCAQKCHYCAFYSEPDRAGDFDRYVDALLRELTLAGAGLRPATVFFGGGTPSLLSLAQWRRIFQGLEAAGMLGAAEWTVECNPATVSADKARLFREFGVNRISLGVQTFDEGLLELLGRIHTPAMVFKSFDILRQAGFNNLNLDLMFALPGQTHASWQRTLETALALQSEHLSAYEIIYEEETQLYRQRAAGAFQDDEDLAAELYDQLLELTAHAGLQQYEIANFARGPAGPDRPPGRACAHNINYWRGGEFVGLGPSASEFTGGMRRRNVADTTRYCEALQAGRRPTADEDPLSSLARAGEIAAFGLRMNCGWSFAEFRQTTGYDLQQDWREEMADLTGRGWAQQTETRFHLTPLGLRFADAAGSEFLRDG